MSRIERLRIKAKLLQKSKKKAGKPIQLKEAYEIIAKAGGYASWRQMKEVVEEHAIFRPSNVSLPYWNNWYNSYDEAKQCMKQDSEFLLPYEKQFFLCEFDYLEALGISKNDPDLIRVGRDWVSPDDKNALKRLLAKLKARNVASN